MGRAEFKAWRARLIATPGDLDPRSACAFSTAIARRLLPGYETFSRRRRWGDPQVLHQALDGLWGMCSTGNFDESVIAAHEETCLSMLPDDELDLDGLFAFSAASSAVYALRSARTDGAEVAASQVGVAIDALGYLWDALSPPAEGVQLVGTTEIDEELDRFRASPIVERETEAQRADIDDLVSVEDWASTIARVRTRAEAGWGADAFVPLESTQ